MVVNSMASSVLQMSGCRGGAADMRNMATSVPRAEWPRLPRLLTVLGLAALTAVQPGHAARCSDATVVQQDHPVAGKAPDDAVALTAFLAARAWLDADKLPAADSQAAQIELPGTSGVCVLLRLDGRVVGHGDDARGDTGMLRRAVGLAISRALGDETIRSVRREANDIVTARLALELELAGPPVPLIGRTVAEAAARVVPGAEGIALRHGESSERAYPSRLLATDRAERSDAVIASLIADAGLPPKDLPQFATADRVALSRFATVRLRESAPRATPSVVNRGGRTIELAEITRGTTIALATQLANRLAAQVVSKDAGAGTVGLLGTFDATRDRFDPPFAGPRESALAALALARAASNTQLPELVREAARHKADALVRSLAALPDSERAEPVDAITLLAAKSGAPGDAALIDTLAARVRGTGEALTLPEGRLSPVPVAFRAAALASLGGEADIKSATELARSIVALADSRPATVLQTALPLSLLAEQSGASNDTRGSIRAAIATIASRLAQSQVGFDAASSEAMPQDLVGGLMPPSGTGGRIGAECLVHAAAIAIALPAGGPESASAPTGMTRRFVRFLAQLTADDPWLGGVRRPEAIRGLVRDSLASDDCPPDALVFGLLLALSAAEGP